VNRLLSRTAGRRHLCAAFFAALTPISAALAQGGVLLQGVADLEAWKTDSASFLLARNNGRFVSPVARVDVWGAAEPVRNIILFAEYLGETGSGRAQSGSYSEFSQGGLRFSPSDAFMFQAGKLPQIVGAFSNRRLSFRNPLISIPDGYSLDYPIGVRAEGTVGIVDYRAGVLDRALARTGYTPDPGSALRPSVGGGITPFTGFRLGASATVGPYLSDTFTVAALRGQNWKEYKQHLVAGELQWAHDYLELYAEVARSSYDVPQQPTAIRGLAWYVESKYTLTPRFYVAARVEQNDYPFISQFAGPFWVGRGVTFNAAEIGAGFRPGASQLLKASLRKDHWLPNASPQAPHDDGYAVALQFSQQFDIAALFQGRP
jgi:hypothetical protein